MELDLKHFKERLLAEKARLEKDMSSVGRRNPSNKEDWQEAETDMDVLGADENEVADKFEELIDNRAVLNELEAEHSAVVSAITRLDKGDYGKCGKCGKKIPHERLEVYPAARDCVDH